MDGNIYLKDISSTYYGADIPTLSNIPASNWSDNTTKDSHIGSLYYRNNGFIYKFEYT